MLRLRKYTPIPPIQFYGAHSLYNTYIHSDEVRRQLNHCVRDGLVRLIKRMGFKGSKIGVEQEGYRLPQDTVCMSHVDMIYWQLWVLWLFLLQAWFILFAALIAFSMDLVGVVVTCIQKVLRFSLSWDTYYPDWGFYAFLRPLKASTEMLPPLGHDCFLQNLSSSVSFDAL